TVEGERGWRSIPWITERFIAEQRRRFASVPARFERLWLNRWVSGEGSFLPSDEVHAAVDLTLEESARAEPGVTYRIGGDLGLTHDRAAIVLLHVAGGKVVIDAIRVWRGDRAHPVSLVAVELAIIELARKFGVASITLDQWQAAGMVER